MKVGTKSLLFGVHQFLWHPFTVWLAWIALYKTLPGWRETICIVVHDWGYWGKANMDGKEGESHPELGARIAHRILDKVRLRASESVNYFGDSRWHEHETTYHDLCLLHSRHYAKNTSKEPSKLCWADKLSISFEPWWLYLPRAWASGELTEYRKICANTGFVPLSASHREWFVFVRARLVDQGKNRKGCVTTEPSCVQGS